MHRVVIVEVGVEMDDVEWANRFETADDREGDGVVAASVRTASLMPSKV